MFSLYPEEEYASAYDIDYERMAVSGIRGVLFDIDNTLVEHGAPADPRAIVLFRRLHELGLATCLLSNNVKPRVLPFARAVQSDFVCDAAKPLPGKYREAMRRMGTDEDSTLFVGDQIFTDILGANLAGIRHTALVGRIGRHEEIQIILKRIPEKPVVFSFRIRKKWRSRRKAGEQPEEKSGKEPEGTPARGRERRPAQEPEDTAAWEMQSKAADPPGQKPGGRP